MKLRVLLFPLAIACAKAPPEPSLEGLDVAYFECNVQPIFDRSCAFPSCHGDPGRPLFVYSTSKTRIVANELLGEPLTDDELCSNYHRASAFARADGKSQLITKPSTLDAEHSEFHEGNYLFGPADPETSCLEGWMQGTTQTSSVPSCALPWRLDDRGLPATCSPRALDCGGRP